MKTGSDGHMGLSSLESVCVVFQLPRKGYDVCREPKERMLTIMHSEFVTNMSRICKPDN